MFGTRSILVLILISAGHGLGQAPREKWTRLESDKKNVSVALPADLVVDTHHQQNGQVFRAVAYRNGVMLDFVITDVPRAEERLDRMLPGPGEQGSSFEIHGVKGRQMVRTDGAAFSERIYLVSGDKLYAIRAETPAKDRQELIRFNYSILVGGEPMFERKTVVDFPEETVAISPMKSSETVDQAYSRKSDDKAADVDYKPASGYGPPQRPANDVTPAVILEKPNPDIRSMIQSGTHPPAKMGAKVVIRLMADGRVGGIIVYSDSDKEFAKACAQAARKIRFVPAIKDGGSVDSVVVEEYGVMTTSTTTLVQVPIR